MDSTSRGQKHQCHVETDGLPGMAEGHRRLPIAIQKMQIVCIVRQTAQAIKLSPLSSMLRLFQES